MTAPCTACTRDNCTFCTVPAKADASLKSRRVREQKHHAKATRTGARA